MKLTKKQKQFVEEYIIDLNATQAAIRAGYSEKTARNIAAENLAKPYIAEAVKCAMKEREERTSISQDSVLKEIAKIAFANGTDFAEIKTVKHKVPKYSSNGLQNGFEEQEYPEVFLSDTSDVPKDKCAAISSIKQTKYGIEVVSYDKLKALELLGRHLGMFSDASNGQSTPENNLLDEIKKASAKINVEDKHDEI